MFYPQCCPRCSPVFHVFVFCPQMFQNPSRNWSRSSPEHREIGPDPPQNLPKPSQNDSKIDPEGLLEPILAQEFRTFFRQRLPELQKNSPRGPKSAQETPQTLPDPSQMEAQTLPNLIFERFFGGYFSTLNLHRFFDGFGLIFCYVSKARHSKYIGFS